MNERSSLVRKRAAQAEQDRLRLESQKQQKAQSRRRRRLVGLGALGTAAVLAAGTTITLNLNKKTYPDPLYGQDAWNLIQQDQQKDPEYKKITEADRQHEFEIWEEIMQLYPDTLPQDPEERKNIIIEIVTRTIYAMGDSRVKEFQDAYRTISEQLATNSLFFNPDLEGKAYAKTLTGVNQEGELFREMSFNGKRILKDRSPALLALAVTHAAVHLDNNIKLREANPSLDPMEFVDFDRRYFETPQNIQAEEALARSIRSDAFQNLSALVNYEITSDFTPLVDAAQRIQCERVATENCWESYVTANP